MIDPVNIAPIEGSFDIAEVEARVLAMPFTAKDPLSRGTYVHGYDDAAVADAIAARRETPNRFSTSTVWIVLAPRMIVVAHRTTLGIEPVRDFVKWLMSSYKTRVTDEYLHDVTKPGDVELDYLFGARDPED